MIGSTCLLTAVTGRYVDVELLRSYMTQITNTFLPLLGISECDKEEWQDNQEPLPLEFIQLQIPLGTEQVL